MPLVRMPSMPPATSIYRRSRERDTEKIIEFMKTVDYFCDCLLPALLVAPITLAFLHHCCRLCAPVGRQGSAYIITFFELAALASTGIPFVAFVWLDQFAWHYILLWKKFGREAAG